ncbi:MAG: DNA-processing protein DprA [Bacillota bacterium]
MVTQWVALSFQVRRAELVRRMAAGLTPRPEELSDAALARARAALQRVTALGGRVVTYGAAEYPGWLRHIPDPPAILYCVGPLRLDREPAVAVVGSRRPSRYGLRMAALLGSELAAAGVTVVSGLALGVDGAAQRAALEAGGATCAVLGCGIDVVYPPGQRQLYQEVARRGLLVSEYPPGTPPLKHHFPERNRIISGLCRGVVVVEGDPRSGSLITAHHALAQGREVCAVPGEVGNPLAEGPLRLIQDGAWLVTSGADVLAALGIAPAGAAGDRDGAGAAAAAGLPPEVAGHPACRAILAALEPGPAPVEALAARTGLEPPDLLAGLSILELAGAVGRLPDGSIHRIKRSGGG